MRDLVITSQSQRHYLEEVATGHAEYVLIAQCMRGRGFTMPAWMPPPTSTELPIAPLLSGGGVATVPSERAELSAARAFGFGIAARREEAARPKAGGEITRQPTAESPSEDSRAFAEALDGPPTAPQGTFSVQGRVGHGYMTIAKHGYATHGCGAESYTPLFGSPRIAAQASYYPEDLEIAVRYDVDHARSYTAATRRWSACFAEQTSHAVSDPQAVAPTLLAKEESGSGAESAAERTFEARTATTDIRCQYRSGFVSTEVRLQQRFAALQTRRYEHLLKRLLRVLRQAHARAEQILRRMP